MRENIALDSPANRTNDRSSESFGRHGALAAGLSLLSRIAPSLASEAASRLFLLVPRVPRPRGDSARFLASGTPFSVRPNGRTLAAWSWGEGPTILLVHGWGGRGAQMRSFVPPLVAAGYRAVTFDGPAHGRSAGLSTSLPEFADAIARVAEATGARGLVAHSMGGASALLALAGGLPLERAVVIGAPSNAENIWREYGSALGLEGSIADGARARLEHRLGTTFRALNAASVASRVSTPVLVIHDRDDAEIPFRCGEEIAGLLPDARLVATRGLGHRRILRDADVVTHALRFFAEGIAPARCENCRRPLGSAGSATLCGNCMLGRDLFDRGHRSAA